MAEYEIPNPYVLARMADCASPDREDSPGAHYLEMVADSVVEAVEYGDDRDDIPWAAADQCVPVYTYNVWRTFVDLGAWQEDPTELGCDGSDMEQAAKVCLYAIGERLAAAVLDDMGEADDS